MLQTSLDYITVYGIINPNSPSHSDASQILTRRCIGQG